MAHYTSEHTGVEIDLAVENANLMLLTGSEDPATSTVGTLGQVYQNTTDGTLFRCTNIAGETYTWTEWADYSLAEKAKVTNATTNIGTLASLTTTEKGSLVGAINEVDSHADTNATSIGTLASLTTTEKGSLVGAINELDTDKVETSAIVNTLTETAEGKVLDARQGKALAEQISTHINDKDNPHKVLGSQIPINIFELTIPAGRMAGDVDGDGAFTQNDFDLISNTYFGQTVDESSSVELKCCDVNDSGEINIYDISALSDIMGGKARQTYSRDILGVWTAREDLTTTPTVYEDYVFYTDIPAAGMVEGNQMWITIDGDNDIGLYNIAQSGDGYVRVFSKLLPILDRTAYVRINVSEAIGYLSNLTTTEKASLVGAINETQQLVSSNSQFTDTNDTVYSWRFIKSAEGHMQLEYTEVI